MRHARGHHILFSQRLDITRRAIVERVQRGDSARYALETFAEFGLGNLQRDNVTWTTAGMIMGDGEGRSNIQQVPFSMLLADYPFDRRGAVRTFMSGADLLDWRAKVEMPLENQPLGLGLAVNGRILKMWS